MGNCYGTGNIPANYGGYGSTYGAGYGYAPGAVGYGGVVDADPITPGIQSTPGVVTPVGPPRITGVGGGVGIGGLGTTYTPGFGGISPSSGVAIGGPVGVPPIGYGNTAVGFSTPSPYLPTGGVVGGPFAGGSVVGGPIGGVGFGGGPIGGGFGGVPVGGVTTTTTYGGPRFGAWFGPAGGVGIGGPYPGAGFGVGGFNRAIDLDPISPGVQTRPGVLTATGPTRIGFW